MKISPVLSISAIVFLFVVLILGLLAIWDIIDMTIFTDFGWKLGLTFVSVIGFAFIVSIITPSTKN